MSTLPHLMECRICGLRNPWCGRGRNGHQGTCCDCYEVFVRGRRLVPEAVAERCRVAETLRAARRRGWKRPRHNGVALMAP